MAEEKKPKKRSGRRAYLNDFHLNEKGEYVYEGKMFVWDGPQETYRSAMVRSGIYAALVLVLTALPELFPAVPMSRFILTVLPWMGQLICAGLTAYAVWRMLWGKNPMRAYIHKASAAKLPNRSMICVFFALFGAGEEIIYLLVRGISGDLFANLVRPASALLCAGAAWLLHRTAGQMRWREEQPARE